MNQSLTKEQPKTVTFQSDMIQGGLAQINRAALVSESADFPTEGTQEDKPRISEKVANHLVNYVGLTDPLKAGKANDNLSKTYNKQLLLLYSRVLFNKQVPSCLAIHIRAL